MHEVRRTLPGLVLLLLLGLPGEVLPQGPPSTGAKPDTSALRMGDAPLRVFRIRPDVAPPGATVTVEIMLTGELQSDRLEIWFDDSQARIRRILPGMPGTLNRYDVEVEVPALRSRRVPVPVRVEYGALREVVAVQLFTVAEPLRIRSISPEVAAPGEVVHITIPPRDAAATFVVMFDRLRADLVSVQPGLLRVEVPRGILDSEWKFHPPFHRVKTPAVEVSGGGENSGEYRGLTVSTPLLGAWESSLTFLLLTLLLAAALALWKPQLVVTLGTFLLHRGGRRRRAVEPEGPVEETLPPPLPPDQLVADCVAGECVVYVGAGLSAASGYPEWFYLVSELLEWAIEHGHVERQFGESLREALREGNADLVADSVIGSLRGREERLHRYLKEIFLRSERPLSAAHRLLKDLRLCGALTTNFDELLERTFERQRPPVFTPQDTDQLLEALANRTFFLLKLYGSLRHPSTLVVSPAQYRESVAGNRAFVQAMESLFFSRTILFVGASLAGIEAYLGGLAFRGIARRPHYALVHVTGSAWRAQADLLSRRYGIQVIPYTASTPSHPEVIDFLAKLRDRVKTETRLASRPEVLVPRFNPLTRVRLENIGPFEELDLELDSRWTLLLGDNGVGKSTVLEAIAAALCGKDAEPYAGGLIRIASRLSRIVLSFGPNEYMATLASREGGMAEIEVAPSRPLETEGWLAIGFPPLRTVSSARAKGPGPEGKRRPTSEDLLPLLKGGVDSRLDELKQWLVNLDYWSKSEPSRSENRYTRLRDEFFQIANELTQGVPIRFKRVDEFTHQVTVETQDGEVPIEAVSQGTASLIGWTGFLLQRLHEVYGQQAGTGSPRDRYALVLVDELDAHMHPSWQQAIVERLSASFPGAQFVASSHSPLIAGSLPPTSIFRFRRDADQVSAHQHADSYKGWRVDQILTGPLFDLQTGRESETERLLLRYTELAARDDLSDAEWGELQQAAAALKVRLPTPVERREARKTFDVLESSMREQLRSMSLEEREKILAEARVQLQEAVTGSRRPE